MGKTADINEAGSVAYHLYKVSSPTLYPSAYTLQFSRAYARPHNALHFTSIMNVNKSGPDGRSRSSLLRAPG